MEMESSDVVTGYQKNKGGLMMILLQWLFIIFWLIPFIWGIAKVINILANGR